MLGLRWIISDEKEPFGLWLVGYEKLAQARQVNDSGHIQQFDLFNVLFIEYKWSSYLT